MSARNIYRSGATTAGLFLFLLLALAAPASAQRFEHLFGDTCNEYGFSGIHTPDGGYISVGSATSPSGNCSNAKHDIYVVKLNSNGTLAWSKTYDINGGNDIGRDIIRSNSSYGGYLIAGYTDNSGCQNMGRLDIVLMRIDTLGVPQWINVYGTADHDEAAFRLIECNYDTHRRQSVGDIVVVGHRLDATPMGMDAIMLRTSATGTILDFKTYGGSRLDGFYGVTESRAPMPETSSRPATPTASPMTAPSGASPSGSDRTARSSAEVHAARRSTAVTARRRASRRSRSSRWEEKPVGSSSAVTAVSIPLSTSIRTC